MNTSELRVLVVGCGGIGGTVAGHLSEMGLQVTIVSRNADVLHAVEARGLELSGDAGRRCVPARVVADVPSAGGPFDFVLLATQPTDVEQAARDAAPSLAPDGRVVCFQNGLCEARVADLVGGPRRVIGGIVAWGATMVEPGVFDKTSGGGFVLGRLEGEADEPLRQLAIVLESIGPVELTDNLRGARWSKLALNCAVSTLGTLNGSTLGAVVRHRHARRLALEIMSEVVTVARAEGVDLKKVAGTLDLDWLALEAAERGRAASVGLAGKHAMVLAVGLRYRRLKSSMLRAIEKGRAPAIDFLNGEIVERGRRREIPTPVNAACALAVRQIADGQVVPGRALVESIYEATR